MVVKRVGVTATRHGLTREQEVTAARLLKQFRRNGATEFHYGFCAGGDEALARLAKAEGYVLHAHPSTLSRWEPSKATATVPDVRYATQPPLARNMVIINECDVLLACPRQTPQREPQRGTRGEGTWWTIHHAVDRDRWTLVVWPDGLIETREGE